MSDADRDGRSALAMDEAARPARHEGRRPKILPRLGLDRALPVRTTSASSLAFAITVTVVSLAAVGLAAERTMRWGTVADAELHEGERLQYFALPDAAPDPSAASGALPGTAPRDPAAPPRIAAPVPRAGRTARDTLAGEGTPLDPTRVGSREIPIGRPGAGGLPSPSSLGEAIGGAVGAGSAKSDCVAPCRDAGSVGYAPGTELARRDSLVRERMQDVVDRAGPAQKPAGFQVGLPGGGPTKEERQRDSTLHANYRKRLQELLARYDSLKADSIARGLIQPPPAR